MRLLYILILQLILTTVFSLGSLAASLPPSKTIVVTNLNDSGGGSFRDAIDTANARSGIDTIVFAVTGQIFQSTPFNSIQDTIVIDATYGNGYAGVPVVSVSGYGISFYDVGASNSVIKGLHIENPNGTSVYCYNANNLTISGCYIVTDFSSSSKDYWANYTGSYGIELQNCNNATIGGTGPNDPNVIYAQTAIHMPACAGGKILNNFIGANRSGYMPGGTTPFYLNTAINLINGTSGITIDGNVIGNYKYAAIVIGASSSDPVSQNNIVQNNILGVAPDNTPLSNGSGINIGNGSNNMILNNTILNDIGDWYYGSTGEAIILSSSSISNKISQNIISCNNAGDIVLNSGNNNYAAPVFSDTAYALSGNSTVISGKANPNDVIEIFIDNPNLPCNNRVSFDNSVVASSSGDWVYTYQNTMPVIIRATATSPTTNNTSAFSSVRLKYCSSDADPYAYSIYLNSRDTICSGVPIYYDIDATNSYGGFSWTTTGSGSFDDSTITYPTYTPGPSDTVSIIITVAATGIAPCPAYYKNDTIVFKPTPKADAGPDQHACSSSSSVNLTGKLFHTPTGYWYSGNESGSFSYDTALTTTYFIDPNDTTLTSIDLYLSPNSTNNGCETIEDKMTIYFDHNNKTSYSGPTDTTVCSNYPQQYLGTITNSGKGYWKTSGTGSFDYYSYYDWEIFQTVYDSLNVHYKPSPKDTVGKSVIITLVADNGVCPWDSSKATLRFRPAPVAVTGVSLDTIICKTNTLKLNGTVYNTPGFRWSTSGYGKFLPDSASLSVTYVPDSLDFRPIVQESAKLVSNSNFDFFDPHIRISLEVDASATCSSDSSYFYLYFASPPDPNNISIENANGSQITACQNSPINLNASYIGDDTGYTYQWTSKGSGQFTSQQDSSAVYQPSDLDNRKVLVPFTVTMTGICTTKKDIQAIILPLPDAGVGTQEQICPEDNITLTATTPGIEQAGYWTLISGTGKFTDSTNSNGQITSISESVNVYRWTISDSSTGCINHTDYTVYKCYAPAIEVYNAVSPNNDGMHDYLEIDNIDAYKGNTVTIYNRWGEKVFEIDDYNNRDRVFTGISNVNGANELPVGPYYYQLKINNKITKGYLVLRR